MLLFLEVLLTAMIVPLAFIAPRLGNRCFTPLTHRIHALASRRQLAVLTILVLALTCRLAVLPIEPVPAPGVHDEFGYLLAGGTFAHGRLTNPRHPMWVHFESMTIIQRPTYCSAFYPAQGAFLALGQVLFGHPFWGVWLSTGLMCATICWALQGWMPPIWAFLGGILAILRLGTFTYWADSYWGGSVAAIGGALALGALPRIKRHHRAKDALLLKDALLMGLGFAILANSRPYEGLIYTLPVLAVLAATTFDIRTSSRQRLVRRAVVPLALVMAATFAFMAYYFWRTTGNLFRPPYLVDVATYMPEPQFFWEKMQRTLVYRNTTMAQFYNGFHVQHYLEAHSHPFLSVVTKLSSFWVFFIGPVLTLPFCVLVGILPYGMTMDDLGEKTRFLIVLCAVSFCGMLLPVSFEPHYAAPMICATYALVFQALRRVRIWDRKNRKGVFVVRAIVVTCTVLFLVTGVALGIGIRRQSLFPLDPTRTNRERARITEELKQQGGKHLVVVHYRSDHDVQNEWVYNDADIDHSKVVWARDMDAANAELLQYFGGRKIWLLEPDYNPPRLMPFVQDSDRNQRPAAD